MGTISFPLTIQEMAKMKEDGDVISLSFSYVCIGCTAVSIIAEAFYYPSRNPILMWSGVVFFAFAVICCFVVCWYRHIFLTDERLKKQGLDRIRTRKYNALDKLEGLDYEEALEKLTQDERQGYLNQLDKLMREEADKLKED